MHVSYAEMVRIAPEALRMLGFPYGHADDAVDPFLCTHAALNSGYSLIEMTDRARGVRWQNPVLQRAEDGSVVIDMKGTPLLLYAARVCDFVIADRRPANDTKKILVLNTFGGWLVPYMGYRLGKAGLSSSIFWLPSDRPFKSEAPQMGAHTDVRRGENTEPIVVRLRSMEENHLMFPRGDDLTAGKLLVLLGDQAISKTANGAETELDIAQATAKFISEGKNVSETLHRRAFTDIAARIRVESSERSRHQAG